MARARHTPGWAVAAAVRSSVALAIDIHGHLDTARWTSQDQFVESAHDLFALRTHLAPVKGRDMPVLAAHAEEMMRVLRACGCRWRGRVLLRRRLENAPRFFAHAVHG